MYQIYGLLILFVTFSVTTSYSVAEDEFLYFAYGSNLLKRRIWINNRSAKFVGPAKLKNYRLDFNTMSKTWNGAVATIVPDNDAEVWGAVWTMKVKDMANLDRQEGVSTGFYFPKVVSVVMKNGKRYMARTYQETRNPTQKVPPQHLPLSRQPSKTYMGVILLGAVQCGLPPEYFAYLMTFKSNGNLARSDMINKLGYPFDVEVPIITESPPELLMEIQTDS